MLVNFDVTVSYSELSQWQLFGNIVYSQSIFVQDVFKIILQFNYFLIDCETVYKKLNNWIAGST